MGIGLGARHGSSIRHQRRELYRTVGTRARRQPGVNRRTLFWSMESNKELLHAVVYEIYFMIRHEPAIIVQ